MSFRINTNTSAMSALRNLDNTNQAFGQSVNRLSTGLRINSAADDPAGLIFSENFRSQISGLSAAISNNQDAINYAKTAEGALDELARLLRDGRALAVSSANSAILSADQLQANQTQWNLIASSIDRIAAETQFGTKRLLNGSAGVNAAVVNTNVIDNITLSGMFNGQSVVGSGNLNVQVTTAATRATVAGTNTIASANLAAYTGTALTAADYGTFYINGVAIESKAGDTWGDIVDKINLQSGATGVTASAAHDGTNGTINLTATTHGTKGNITLTDQGVLLSAANTVTGTGINAVAQIDIAGGTPVTFTGGQMGNDGLTLTDTDGNTIRLKDAASVATYTGAGFVTVGSAQFQVGANVGQRATLSIGNFASTALNVSGIDMTNTSGANDALQRIDAAVTELSRRRGEIGSFMRNVLESNVRSLGIAKENLAASESAVRDTDIAQEMTVYTKYQILQQSGLSVLAQANQAPQAVLALLRG